MEQRRSRQATGRGYGALSRVASGTPKRYWSSTGSTLIYPIKSFDSDSEIIISKTFPYWGRVSIGVGAKTRARSLKEDAVAPQIDAWEQLLVGSEIDSPLHEIGTPPKRCRARSDQVHREVSKVWPG